MPALDADDMSRVLVLASGHPPQPPPLFDYAEYADRASEFDPVLKKEAPRKVLASGKPPQPPPPFDPSKVNGKFEPSLEGSAPKEKLPPPKAKFLPSGLLPQPPPAFTAADLDPDFEFDPPVTFAAENGGS